MTLLFQGWSWFTGTAAGRVVLGIAAGLALLFLVRRSGAVDERAKIQARTQAQQIDQLKGGQSAEAAFRSDGGAAARLRDGAF